MAVATHVVTCASIVQSFAVYALLEKTMSICDYFKPTVSLPNPNGPLKERIRFNTTCICDVNEKVCPEIEHRLKKPGCHGSREPYVKLTPEQMAVIGRRAAEHGVTAAIWYFSKRFDNIELKETTIRRLKNVQLHK